MDKVSDATFRALVTLLDDESPKVRGAARDRLLKSADDVRVRLQAFCEEEGQTPRGILAQTVLKDVESQRTEDAFLSLIRGSTERERDSELLEEGVFLLCRISYPQIDLAACRGQLDAMAEAIDRRLGLERQMRPVVEAFGDHLFGELGFKGAGDDYYHPDSSFLNKVLENRKGLPIALSTIYICLGRRLSLPIRGVGFPRHFLVSYGSGSSKIYIDPYHQGRLLDREGCRDMLKAAGIEYQESHLRSVTSLEILGRTLVNLIHAYRKAGEQDEVARFSKLFEHLSDVMNG